MLGFKQIYYYFRHSLFERFSQQRRMSIYKSELESEKFRIYD